MGRGLVGALAVALVVFAGSAQSAGSLTRPRAAAAALKLLQPQREPGLNGRVTVYMAARPVPAGVTISEGVTHRQLVVLRKAAWLVWEDLGHTVLFPHASKLLLLDAATAKTVLLRPLVFFPLVNGQPPAFFGSSAAYLGSRGAIYKRAPGKRGASARTLAGRAAGPDLSGDGLVTAGARADAAFSNDFKQIEKTADDLKLDKEKAEPTEQGIVDAIGKLTKKGKKDIFLFVGGHGYPKNDKYYTDKDGKKQLSQPGSKSPQLILDDKGNSAVIIGPSAIKRILKKFPGTTFKLVLDSCYSGRFISELSDVANLSILITSAPEDMSSSSGFGASLAVGLKAWALPPGGGKPDPPDLAGGLQQAFGSQAVTTNSQLTKDDPQVLVPGQKPPQITSITATFVMPVTTYVAVAADPNANDKLTYQWAKSNPCGVFSFSGSTAAWSHPDGNQPGACPVEPVHPGTIAVVVSDGYFTCAGQYDKGSAQGVELQPMKSPCNLLSGHIRPK